MFMALCIVLKKELNLYYIYFVFHQQAIIFLNFTKTTLDFLRNSLFPCYMSFFKNRRIGKKCLISQIIHSELKKASSLGQTVNSMAIKNIWFFLITSSIGYGPFKSLAFPSKITCLVYGDFLSQYETKLSAEHVDNFCYSFGKLFTISISLNFSPL